MKKNDHRLSGLLAALNHYLFIFLFIAFVISCSMMLFLTTLAETMDLTLTEGNIAAAAKITFINVILLSLICTAADGIRRKLVISRPIKRITVAARRIAQGDFSIRIPFIRGIYGADGFNQIIRCFNKMAEELSGVETLRADFIANVSHELKTPLAAVQNYGTLLQQPGLSDEKRMEYARSISEVTRRLTNLITNILKLNKLENQQIFPYAEEYDLSEQLCECLLQFETLWEDAGINIETSIPDDIFIRADAELFSLVWNNLLSNAFKFTNRGGTISLTLEADDIDAVVRITDTGCGITPEVGAHIFEKFYQGDTSRGTTGNGLGLALVKRIMDITQSEIRVESEPEKGSSFTVHIRRR